MGHKVIPQLSYQSVAKNNVTKNFAHTCEKSQLSANKKYMSYGSGNESHDTSYIYKASCKILVACNR